MQKMHPYVSPAIYERMEWAQQFMQNKLMGVAGTASNVTAETAANGTLEGLAANATNTHSTLIGNAIKKVYT